MKKLFLLSSMLLMTSGVFANDIVEKKNLTKENETTVTQVCCRRGVTDDATGQNATARGCVDSTGDAQIDMGKACEKALKAAKAALALLLE
ncbi:hypothetical protein WMW71_02840 [Flavobacterium buctense]|uniref:Uncharacterized protein n=1 Tax=Flavobacterium buctense TaxID=1648146 RepID=A0ABU9E141_9FLAO|nr:hypothetical protein [Flavobacterium buctense]